jgi:hypothetical protein
MLTEPCRGVFTQSGRWISIQREALTAASRLTFTSAIVASLTEAERVAAVPLGCFAATPRWVATSSTLGKRFGECRLGGRPLC